MCNSLTLTFAWVGAILVNLGFVALISWGVSTLWPLGFLLNAIYTGSLFSLAKWLQKHENEISQNDYIECSGGEAPFEVMEEGPEEHGKISLPVNLLFGAAVLSFGVTCFLLAINLVKECPGSPIGPSVPDYKWATNLTELPNEIRSWASTDFPDNPYDTADFGHVKDTKTTVFRGIRPDENGVRNPRATLWSVGSDQPPVRHPEYSFPESFVPVSSSSICFKSHISKQVSFNDWICCSDGIEINVAKPTPLLFESGQVGSFLPNAGLLWFKQYSESTASGTLVYSLDPEDMTTELHSCKVKAGGDSNHRDLPSCDVITTKASSGGLDWHPSAYGILNVLRPWQSLHMLGSLPCSLVPTNSSIRK